MCSEYILMDTHFVLPLLTVITLLWSDLVAWTTSDVGVNVLSASIEWTRRNWAPPYPHSVRCILLSRTNRVVTVLVRPFSPVLHTFYIPSTSTDKKSKCRKKTKARINVTSDGSAQRSCKGSSCYAGRWTRLCVHTLIPWPKYNWNIQHLICPVW
jgi:hypothetical protein